MKRLIESVRIILLCIAAAITYGIVHDLVTAHVCVEYFSVAHPQVLVRRTDNPIILAITWGILATWWVGVILGVLLAMASQFGKYPPRPASSLVRPIALLMFVSASFATIFGVIGYCLAESGSAPMLQEYKNEISPSKHSRFLADLFAHNASYASGFFGGLIVIANVFHSRKRIQNGFA